jgi:hypothetical protein
LSPQIFHFSEDEMFWECYTLKASETSPKGIPSRYVTSSQRALLPSGLGSPNPHKLLEHWQLIVATYIAGALTFTSDELNAVSALARQVSLIVQSLGNT